ncbi:DUF2058 domain-containing protein [Oceanospirillum sp. HFRX-1_2]
MSKSLQDQLLKAGLTNKKKVKQAENHKKKQAKVKRTTGQEDEVKLRAEQQRKEKAERDRLLNLERKAEEEKKAVKAQVKQLIEMNRLENYAGDLAHNFVMDKKVKKINVQPKISDQLAKPDWPIVLNEKAPDTGDAEEDDPYADFQIPDDLMW